MKKESGFTLVEVLIASAIIMASIGVLMQLFASSLGQSKKAGEVAHLLIAQRVIVHTLERVNPALQAQGKGMAEGLTYQWHAVVHEPFRPVFDPAGFSKRKIALFTMIVDVDAKRDNKYHFNYEQLGWKGQ